MSDEMQGTPNQITLYALAPDSQFKPLGAVYVPQGFDPTQILALISAIMQLTPQVIALIQAIIEAFKPKPGPAPNPNPGPTPPPSPFTPIGTAP